DVAFGDRPQEGRVVGLAHRDAAVAGDRLRGRSRAHALRDHGVDAAVDDAVGLADGVADGNAGPDRLPVGLEVLDADRLTRPVAPERALSRSGHSARA